MNLTLSNKIALVTGGTSGIGRATAVLFAKAGAKVVIAGRRDNLGAEVVAEIEAAGGEAHFIQADVSKESDVAALVAGTVAHFGGLHIAFNNAGVESAGPLLEIEEAEYRRIFDTNVWGVITSMKHEIPAILKSGGGSIINTSSVAGHVAFPGIVTYAASKHAVEGLTKAAALEFAKQGIRINAVSPGAIATEMFDRFTNHDPNAVDHMAAMHPIGRFGQGYEIAQPVLWLASEASSFVTGQSIVVDGGYLAQ